MKFSVNLSNLRREKEYSQEYLVERLGVTRRTISKWENGTAMPDLKKLTEIAELFGTTMDKLLGTAKDGTVYEKRFATGDVDTDGEDDSTKITFKNGKSITEYE